MKTITKLYLVVALILPVLCACDSPGKAVEQAVENIDNKKPLDFGVYGKLMDAKYDSDANTVTVDWQTSTDFVNVDTLASDAKMAKEFFFMSFLNDKLTSLVTTLIEADGTLKVVYKGETDAASAEVTMTAADLAEIQNMPIISTDKRNTFLLNAFASRCIGGANLMPDFVDSPAHMAACAFDDGNMVVTMCLDDAMGPAKLRQITNIDQIFLYNVKQESKTNVVLHQVLKLLDEMKCGLKIDYTGANPADKVELSLTPAQVHSFATNM